MVVTIRLPSLSQLQTDLLGPAVTRSLIGSYGSTGSPQKCLITSFVRLVEKCIHEYELGRGHLEAFAGSSGFTEFFRAQGHFENSIQTLQRTLLFLDALITRGVKGADGSPVLPKRNRLAVLSKSARDRVNDLRDAIEHMDDRIRKTNTYPAGHAIGLHPSKLELRLGNASVSYAELAHWLTELHGLADTFANYPAFKIAEERKELGGENT